MGERYDVSTMDNAKLMDMFCGSDVEPESETDDEEPGTNTYF